MNIDKNKFFRKASLCICGNLDIEKALQESLKYLKKYMPVDRMFLQLFDHGFGSMRTIADVTEKQANKINLLTRLSEKSIELIKKSPNLNLPEIMILQNPMGSPIAQEMLKFHNINPASLIIFALVDNTKPLGSLILISLEKIFNENHTNLIYLLKEPLLIAMSNTLKHMEVIKLKEMLEDDNRYLHNELRKISGDTIIGANFGLKDVMEKVRQVAAMDSPVLILGETGVGKDVIANAIHYSSRRNTAPFVSINCGAIPESLIDSELFGHEKGAFTNALNRKRGRFERANTGTIFLDEIGELPPGAQVRLLRVLQNKEIERVGGTEVIKLNIRIIAATNKDLMIMIKENKFREDLWFRLNVFPITIPPLRERKSDIPALTQYFINQKTKDLKLYKIPVLDNGALDILMNYNWPGNVRELENIVERALILNKDSKLKFNNIIDNKKENINNQNIIYSESDNLDNVIKSHINKILSKTNGKVHGPDGAAELLGINPSTLRNRMNKLGIKYGLKK